MKDGFSLLEILVALVLFSAFMLSSFEVMLHLNHLESSIHQEYIELNLT